LRGLSPIDLPRAGSTLQEGWTLPGTELGRPRPEGGQGDGELGGQAVDLESVGCLLGSLMLDRTPLLLVEVGSRATRLLDMGTKRLAYEAAGVPEYWLVDPDEPSLTVLRLVEGHYEEVGRVSGDERYDATYPFPVRSCRATWGAAAFLPPDP
jgi:hypothetical protein